MGFVDSSNYIREEFLRFIHCDEGVTDRGLCQAVTNTLSKYSLDLVTVEVKDIMGRKVWQGK